MYIALIGPAGKKYVYLKRAYRKNGKSCSEIVENFGKLDDLLDKNPNAIEELRKKYHDMTHQTQIEGLKKAEQILAGESIYAQPSNIGQIQISYSNYILKSLWNNDLNLRRAFIYLQNQYYSKLPYNINTVISALIYLKTYKPNSIKALYREKANLLGAPFEDISLNQLYDSLTILAKHKTYLMQFINKRLDDLLHRKHRLIFFDITNIYFETALSDEEKEIKREDADKNLKKVIKQAIEDKDIKVKKGITEENYDYENASKNLQSEIRGAQYLRMRGKSKEKRTDLPLISIALIIDENAIPVDFEVFAGNRSEYKSMSESIEEFRKKYNIKDVVVVADRGINSALNLQKLLDKGYGFIVAQKVSNLKEEILNKIFDEKGYVEIGTKKDNNGEIRKRKVIDWVKEDEKKKIKVSCKLVVTYDSMKEKRDLAFIIDKEKKAKEAVINNKKPTKRTIWASFINTPEKQGTEKKQVTLNQEAIDLAKKLCGYSAVVYHNVPKTEDNINNTEGLTDKEMEEAYQHLVQIEDCFRVMKTNLNLHPVYVWTEDHIKGHVTSCILALILLRRLQMRTKEKGQELTINEIQKGLKEAYLGMQIKGKEEGTAIFNRISWNDDMYKGKEHLSPKTLKQKEKELFGKPELSLSDQLMRAVDLTPIPGTCDRFTLAKCINTKFKSDQSLIDSHVYHRYADSVSG